MHAHALPLLCTSRHTGSKEGLETHASQGCKQVAAPGISRDALRYFHDIFAMSDEWDGPDVSSSSVLGIVEACVRLGLTEVLHNIFANLIFHSNGEFWAVMTTRVPCPVKQRSSSHKQG